MLEFPGGKKYVHGGMKHSTRSFIPQPVGRIPNRYERALPSTAQSSSSNRDIDSGVPLSDDASIWSGSGLAGDQSGGRAVLEGSTKNDIINGAGQRKNIKTTATAASIPRQEANASGRDDVYGRGGGKTVD